MALVALVSIQLVGCCYGCANERYAKAGKSIFLPVQELRYRNAASGEEVVMLVQDYVCSYGEMNFVDNGDCECVSYESCGQSIVKDEESKYVLDYSLAINNRGFFIYFQSSKFEKIAYSPDTLQTIEVLGVAYTDVYHLHAANPVNGESVSEIYFKQSVGVLKLVMSNGEVWELAG